MISRRIARIILTTLLISITLLWGLYYVIGVVGRSIDVTIDGANYQLGAEHISQVAPESVHFHGKVFRDMNGLRTFKGTISFVHHTIVFPIGAEATTIHFDHYGYGPIMYGYFEVGISRVAIPRIYNNGVLFVNSDFSEVTVLRMMDIVAKDGSVGKSWSAEDGFMFAGPATSREQALNISNKLMKKYLTNSGYAGGQFVLK